MLQNNNETFDTKKVIVALDNYSIPMAEEIIDKYKSDVYGFKVNHTLYEYINKKSTNIFCDFKLFDIPNTMCSVIEKLIDDGANMVTVHMSNNLNAMEAISKYSKDIKILGVTLLTSWNHQDSYFVYDKSPSGVYERSISLMRKYGFWGAICSPRDLKTVNLLLDKDNDDLKKICPGIRKKDQLNNDQIRVSTPEYAFENGADYLVMGRGFFNDKG
jgi:orotidine-5'-phosphate decarboxylase